MKIYRNEFSTGGSSTIRSAHRSNHHWELVDRSSEVTRARKLSWAATIRIEKRVKSDWNEPEKWKEMKKKRDKERNCEKDPAVFERMKNWKNEERASQVTKRASDRERERASERESEGRERGIFFNGSSKETNLIRGQQLCSATVSLFSPLTWIGFSSPSGSETFSFLRGRNAVCDKCHRDRFQSFQSPFFLTVTVFCFSLNSLISWKELRFSLVLII